MINIKSINIVSFLHLLSQHCLTDDLMHDVASLCAAVCGNYTRVLRNYFAQEAVAAGKQADNTDLSSLCRKHCNLETEYCYSPYRSSSVNRLFV